MSVAMGPSLMRFRHRFSGPVQTGVVDVVVGHEADDTGGDGAGQDAGGPEVVEEAGRVRVAEDDHVGGEAGRVAARRRPAVGHGLGQAAGPGVVVGQAVDHGPQGQQAGGGDDTGLAHGAAQTVALDPGLGHDVGRAGQEGADGGAEALGQAGHDGGDRRRVAVGRDRRGHLGVEEAGAVHVDGQSGRRLGQGVEGGQGPGGPAGGHVGVLDADEGRCRVVVSGRRPCPGDVGRVEGTVVVVQFVDLDAGVAGRGGVLVDDEMLSATGQDEGAGAAEDAAGPAGWP